MMLTIDTGGQEYKRGAVSSQVDDTQNITITTPAQSSRMTQLIVSNIKSMHNISDLEEYWASESLLLDSLYLFDRHILPELCSIYQARLEALKGTPSEPDSIW